MIKIKVIDFSNFVKIITTLVYIIFVYDMILKIKFKDLIGVY